MTSTEYVGQIGTILYRTLFAGVYDAIAGSDQAGRQSLVVFWGSRGSGKTTALRYLAAVLSDQKSGIRVLGPFDAGEGAADEYAQEISRAVSAVSGEVSKIVVLLDNLDALVRTPNAAALYAFEQDVLVKFVQHENITIVATSRIPITWRDWETKSRHQTLAMPYLDREEVGRQALANEINPDDAFRLTLGHPQMLAWLLASPDISGTEIAVRAAAYFLDGLPAATAESATLMSLLPTFDVGVLREVMPLEKSSIAEGFYSQYLDRIHDLVAAGILTWSASTGGYQFLDGVVRYHLARSFQSRRPDDAYRIHIEAAKYYQSEAARAGALQLFFVNVIYHLTCAAAVTGAERPGQPGVDWVHNNLPNWVDARWDDVRAAWRTGAGDWVVKEELDRLIGAEDTARITALLEIGRHALAVPADSAIEASHAAETSGQEVEQ